MSGTRGRLPIALAAAWGFAEATLFFLVPDILLSWIALRRPKLALASVAAALIGALAGGLLMYELARSAPDRMRAAIDRVPGIGPELRAEVHQQIVERGPLALLLGIVSGRPYKVYAVESGAISASLPLFLAGSVVARAARFLAGVLITRFAARRLARGAPSRPRLALELWAVFWLALYLVYFLSFGW